MLSHCGTILKRTEPSASATPAGPFNTALCLALFLAVDPLAALVALLGLHR